jgi:hypothetical protein
MGFLALAPLLLAAGCAQPAQSGEAQRKAVESATKTAEFRAAARSALGDESKVILSGDLAGNGHIQLLVVESLETKPRTAAAGLVVSRAAILEQDGTDWREIFLADAQLKNTRGFLGGTPRDAVNAWNLIYRQPATGLTMLFTPLDQGASAQSAIEVRWNAKAGLYQSLDRATGQFLAESPSLGPAPEFEMKQ